MSLVCLYIKYFQFPKGSRFPMYIKLCEFSILILLKFSLKLIHKKAIGLRRIKSLDTRM